MWRKEDWNEGELFCGVSGMLNGGCRTVGFHASSIAEVIRGDDPFTEDDGKELIFATDECTGLAKSSGVIVSTPFLMVLS
jgi:hypothetical protein